MLGSEVEGREVLDLFAGTGALGIEALSRGAAHAVFVERRAPACQVIRANLQHTRLLAEAELLCMPAERALSALQRQFGLVLLDPPYADPRLPVILEMLGGARIIGAGTIVVFEHSPRFAVDDRYGRLVLRRQRVYGDTAVSIFDVSPEESG
jgi:16S rRNA (guanine(966)-N(2))-methyltransferase RsmD